MLSSVPGYAIAGSIVVAARHAAGRSCPFLRPCLVLRSWSGRFPVASVLAAALLTIVQLLMPPVALAAPMGRTWPRAKATARHTLERQHNEAAPMILGGRPGTSYDDVAHDMAAVLAAGSGVRLIVVDAPGGIDTLRDLTLLRGIDLALVPGNVLDFADSTNALGPDLKDRLSYVASLYGEEIHVVAGPGIGAFDRLAGKKVAVPPDDGNVEFTARDLLRRLHIDAEVVKLNPVDAIDDVQSGALGAILLVSGKPSRFVTALPKDGGLHLLPVPQKGLGDAYSPRNLTADDYPTLILPTQTIDTVSVVITVIANKTTAYDDSHHRVAKFVPAFFGSLSDLSGPHWHPKWGEVNLAGTLSGWSRLPEAKDWLAVALREQSDSVHKTFDQFLRASNPGGQPSPAARQRLFEEYLEWARSGKAPTR